MSPPAALVDGVVTDRLSVRDRGLQFGDGVFETMAVVDGRVRFVDYHLERLAEGCGRLRLPLPGRELLEREMALMCAGRDHAVLKLTVTRGPGGRGYRAPARPAPTRVLSCTAVPPPPAAASLTLRVCATRLGRNPALAGLKHLNRLEQVLARLEWDDEEIADGLMLDEDDNVIEATSANVFAVRGGVLLTPELCACGVRGVMRRVVLEVAAASGLGVREARVSLADVEAADELFLTNAVIGVVPVGRLGERRWPGGAGPVTRHLIGAVATAAGAAAP